MKFQACKFKKDKNSPNEQGIAKLTMGFGAPDVEFIIDMDGNKLKDFWDYFLEVGPGAFIDTDVNWPMGMGN